MSPAARTGAGAVEVVELGKGLPQRSQWRRGFDVADLDGDGLPDIVSGPPRKGVARPGYFLGDGHGAFRFWSEATYPKGTLDYGDAKVLDLNRDGVPDVVLACHLRGLLALMGDGKAGFIPWSDGLPFARPGPEYESGFSFSSQAVGVADFDRDGRPDIVALGEGPARPAPGQRPGGRNSGLRLYLNRDSAWQEEVVADAVFGDSLAVDDLNGDGFPDVVVSSNVLGYREVLKLGNGKTFRSVALPGLPENALVSAVATGYVDMDGSRDVALSTQRLVESVWTSEIRTFRMKRDTGAWVPRIVHAVASRSSIPSLALGDVNGDATPDLVALGPSGETLVFLGGGGAEGELRKALDIPAPAWRAGCSGSHVRLADLDGDGRDEIVASFAGEPTTSSLLAGEKPCSSGGGFQVWKVASRSGPSRAP